LNTKIPVEYIRNRHQGQRALLLGNGPSLEQLDLDKVADDVLIIGMHRTWRLVNPPYHVILERKEYLYEMLFRDWLPKGIIITKRVPVGRLGVIPGVSTVNVHGVGVLKQKGEMSFDLTKGTSSTCCGHLALEAVTYMGCNPIYLIGYDAQDGQGHAFSIETMEEKFCSRERTRSIMDYAKGELARHRPDLQVFNLNPKSAITCFPMRTLDEVHK